MRSHAGWSCAQAKTACAEVELVRAGNEYNQQQWRHARPYVQIAEDLVEQAQAAATACPSALPVPVPVPLQPLAGASAPVAALAAASVPMELAANVVFNFDKFAPGDIRAFSQDSLRRLVEQAKDRRIQVKEIRLIGHADRLNGTGQRDYNEQLSSKRAQTVRQLLIDAGLSAAAIRFEFVGDRQPVAQCQGKLRSNTELEECLLPNRRVEVQLLGQRQP
jgi:outer membrane protein OmpA-like peptidoglycan-associated protein